MKHYDWGNLPFGYIKTDYNVRCNYKNGEWGKIEISGDELISISISATCLHYGQSAFEGLKAYKGVDDKIRIFRIEENAKRLQSASKGIMMPEVPTSLFTKMVYKVIELNKDYIPPYESGSTLYIRPLLIGTSAFLGVKPSEEYLFAIFATPVGPYYNGGFKANPYMIVRNYDRAAPKGTGMYKVAGNYAGSLKPNAIAHKKGYAGEIYLDAKEKKYIEECGAANFFAIKDNTYITPKSTAVLPSITNNSLMQIARDMNLKVEQRKISIEELNYMQEAAACGTGSVVSPINYIDDLEYNTRYVFANNGRSENISYKLYHHLKCIQTGSEEDKYGWTTLI